MIRKAKPVWLKTTGVNQYMEARQCFSARETAPALLQICADTEYAAFLNGQYVGSGQYHTFRNVNVYDEYDVTCFTKEDENELAVIAYAEGGNSQTHEAGQAFLAFALQWGEQTILSGADTRVRLHPCYVSGEMEKVTPQLGYTYHYRADAMKTPWQQAAVIDTAMVYRSRPVKRCVLEPPVTGRLIAQGIVRRTGTGTPAELMQYDGLFFRKTEEILEKNLIRQRSDGVFLVLDLGREYTGLLTMELEAAAGTVIDIGWGEHLEDLRVRTFVGGRNFACRYICADGLQRFTGYFRRLGARFLQIHFTRMAGDVRFHQIGLRPLTYPLDREGAFRCNDFLLNRLCEAASRTLKLCMHEHYEDCPWREQALYAFDSYLQMLCGYYLFGEYEFAKASLKLLADSQRADGMLRMCAPTGISTAIPSFSLSWLPSLVQYVLYSGDLEFGQEMLPVAERMLGAFAIKDDLVQCSLREDNWHFYEWTDGMDGTEEPGTGSDAPINFYYILACEAYQSLCGWLDVREKPVYHQPDKIRRAVREEYYMPEKGLFRTRAGDSRYHELTQTLAVCSGTASLAEMADKLLGQPCGMIPNTLSTSVFKYEALLSAGTQYADAVLEEIADIWGGMLFSGADTLWEVSEGAKAFSDAGSLCHGWSAVPVYLLYKYYLGYAPTAPGFCSYQLQPRKSKYLSEIHTVLFAPGWKKSLHTADRNREGAAR